MVCASGREVGCLLLADHSDDDQWEIVYAGLVPEWRPRLRPGDGAACGVVGKRGAARTLGAGRRCGHAAGCQDVRTGRLRRVDRRRALFLAFCQAGCLTVWFVMCVPCAGGTTLRRNVNEVFLLERLCERFC